MSDSLPQIGAPLHGPGGLLATPGLGSRRRKRRKWGMRTKAKQIVGNLYRGDTGQFQAGGGSTPAGATPRRGNVLSKQPKPTARPKPVKAAAPKKGGGAKKPAGAKPKDPAVVARQQQRDQEHAEDRANSQADRAQRQQDRQARLERQASRDQERVKRQQDAAGKRAAAEMDRELAKRVKKPAKAGGAGSKKPSADDQRQERGKKALDTAGAVGMAPADLGALRDAAEGIGSSSPALTQLGLVGSDGQATDQGRRALSALERGDVRQYNAALQDAQSRMGREQGARDRKQQAEDKRAAAATERQAKQRRQIDRLKRRAQSGAKLSDSQIGQLQDAGVIDAGGRWTGKSFAVFKDHTGAHRWLARTTTAYRDRDQEIISEAALDTDSQRMTASEQFGPLRYWHVGQPDPFDAAAPWGPGLDIGDCDYSTLIGRTRIESGTFRDAAIAQKVARKADQYELSPGFFHPIDQPDSGGVFSAIRTFERSIVPIKYGRASNLFTGLAVKERRMDMDEMERRFKAAVVDLGLDKDQALDFGQQLIQTEKTAAAQGIAFKSDDAPAADADPVYPDVVINGVTYKAAPPDTIADAAPVETKADDPMEAIADEVIEEPEEEMSGDYLGDMSWDEFAAKLSELLAPVLKMQDMVKAMGDAHAELKTMYGGVAQKDDARATEIASLKASLKELSDKLAQIEGNQPTTILPDELEAALKSAGPAAPASPDRPEITDVVNDPNRPWAGWAAQTYPKLYEIPGTNNS